MRWAEESHFSLINVTMNSGATSANPNMTGKEMKQVKRSILEKTRRRRSMSSPTSTKACDGRGTHGVPLVGLVVSAYLVFVVKFAEHNGEDVVVHTDEDVGDEHLGRKGKHLPNGSEEG